MYWNSAGVGRMTIIAIVTSFAGRLYGMRSHKKKKVVESVKQAIRDC